MEKSQISAEEIWAKLLENDEIGKRSDAAKQIIRSFVEKLPEILLPLLEQPATLVNILTAKVLYLTYCVENGFCVAIYEQFSEESLGFLGRKGFTAFLGMSFCITISHKQYMIDNLMEILKEFSETEEDIIFGSAVDLKEDLCEFYKSDPISLTIGELLLLDPYIIIRND